MKLLSDDGTFVNINFSLSVILAAEILGFFINQLFLIFQPNYFALLLTALLFYFVAYLLFTPERIKSLVYSTIGIFCLNFWPVIEKKK